MTPPRRFSLKEVSVSFAYYNGTIMTELGTEVLEVGFFVVWVLV